MEISANIDNNVLGYDCDDNEIEEFRILRFPFSSDIENWDEEFDVDPRFYTLIRGLDGCVYAISVYDDWHKKYIRRYEGLNDCEEIPILIKTVSEMKCYEVAYSGINGKPWYYDRDREELRRNLDNTFNIKKRVKKK